MIEVSGNIMENDALALEYKLQDRRPLGNIDIADLVNDPTRQGIAWVSGYGLKEESLDFACLDLGSLSDDLSDPGLVCLHTVDSFSK